MQLTELGELGKRILVAREEKKMSQEQLANAIGCSQSALSNYEKGKRQIYLSQLEKVAETLEKPLNYFLDNLDQQSGKNNAKSDENEKKISYPPISVFIQQIINNIFLLDRDDINEVDQFIKFLLWKKNGS